MVGSTSKKIIDQRLKEMEKEGLITRKFITFRPIAVEYEATQFCRSALGILDQLQNWSQENEL